MLFRFWVFPDCTFLDISIYVDGIYLRRNWGGEYENVAVLVAIAVNRREMCGFAFQGKSGSGKRSIDNAIFR